MEYRKATLSDLNYLKTMYIDIVLTMKSNGVDIWDEIYPIEYLENDINNDCFYIMLENNNIVSGFALYESHEGSECFNWEDDDVFYIDRLGIHIDYLRQGKGEKTLDLICKIARENNKQSVRLLVVDSNIPAIKLYEKYGFIKATGEYLEHMDYGIILKEYGYHKECCTK